MNNDDIARQLHEIDQASAAPWLAWAKSAPRWTPLFFGAWAALFTLNIGLMHGLTQALLNLVLLALCFGVVFWQTKQTRAWPTGKTPAELRSPAWTLAIGAGVVAVLATGATYLANIWVGASVAGVLTYGLMVIYLRQFVRAAQRLEARVS